MYQTMMQANAQQGADIISCGYFLEYENQCIPATNLKEVPSDAIETRRFLKYIYERDSYKGVASYLWTRLLKRELLFSDDGELMQEFSSEYDVSEDIVFLAHIMKNSKKSLYINRPMYYYLQRKDSACHDERKQLASLSWVRAYLEIIEVLKEEDIEQDVYNLVIRMIVYRCGKFMELAIKYQDNKAYDWLKDVVTKYYNIYVMTNREYPDRVEWLENLLIGMK